MAHYPSRIREPQRETQTSLHVYMPRVFRCWVSLAVRCTTLHMVGKQHCPSPRGARYFTPVERMCFCVSYPVSSSGCQEFPGSRASSPAPKHIPPPRVQIFRFFTRTKHPVRLDVDLNAGDRETEIIYYGIMIPSPITPPKTPDIRDSFAGSRGDFEIPTRATTSIRGGESVALRRLAGIRRVSLRFRSQRRVLGPLILQPRPLWVRVRSRSEAQINDGLESSEITVSLMKFGCLGPREFHWRCQGLYNQVESGRR